MGSQEPTVQRAALPVLAPPETPEPKATFGAPLKNKDPGHPVDLDMDDMVIPEEKPEEEEEDIDEPIELDELEGTPFTYFYLSAEGSPQAYNAEEEEDDDDDVILMEEALPPTNSAKDLEEEDEGRRQATTHISISPDVVLASTGEEGEKWLATGKKEIDNLTIPKAITALSPQERTALKEKAQLEGGDFIELPAKVVFAIKPEKYKIRIVACGSQTKDTYGKITTTDLDTCMLRFILSWAASSRFNTIASLDVTAAFLNADLPPGRVVVLRPPTVLDKLGLIPTGFVWRVRRAVYGLREAPSLWSQERTKVMETMTFRSRGESYKVLISEIHRSILLLVREQDVLASPQLTYAGLSQRVQPKDVMALCGIYVDDFLSVGPHDIVTSILEHLRSIWKTTDPVSSPLLGYYFIRKPTLKLSWKSTRMSLPRDREHSESPLRKHARLCSALSCQINPCHWAELSTCSPTHCHLTPRA